MYSPGSWRSFASPTGDGAQKRGRNEKPPWYLDKSHEAAVYSADA